MAISYFKILNVFSNLKMLKQFCDCLISWNCA